MRHPSKVGSFCSRKLERRRFNDRVLGGGSGPLPCGKHLTEGRPIHRSTRKPWWLRLKDAARQRFLRQSSADPSQGAPR